MFASRYIVTLLVGSVVAVGALVLAYVYVSSQPHTPEVTAPEWTVKWPFAGSTFSGWQTFVLESAPLVNPQSYRVTWSVDGGIQSGTLTWENNTYTTTVDTSLWDWNSNGEYQLEFVVFDSAEQLAHKVTMPIYTHQVSVSLPVASTTNNVMVIPTISTETTPPPSISTAPAVKGDTTFRVNWIEAPITSNQTFTFAIDGYDVNTISAFWNSVGGHKNQVFPKNGTYEASINVNGWRWRGTGPYEILFSIVDTQSLTVLADELFSMTWQGVPGESALLMTRQNTTVAIKPVTPASRPAAVAPSVPVTPTAPPAVAISTLPAGSLFVPPKPAVERSRNEAVGTAKTALNFILQQPGAMWLNGDGNDSDEFLQSVFAKSSTEGSVPAFVLYNIPFRDCGSHSSGGASGGDVYKAWIDRLVAQFNGERALVVVEPDALAQLNCAPESARDERLELIAYAVNQFASKAPSVQLYIDAGHPFWVSADEMAARLARAGIANARGFSLNVSNYVSTADNKLYGTYLSTLLGGKQFVIDTSRNGNGPADDRQWCNPRGRALGESSRLTPNNGLIDAYLWIKYPGESDGQCNGGPGAGQWWAEYAIELYTNRP